MENFPYAGKKFILTMNTGLKVINNYSSEGKTIEIEFLSSDLVGTKMVVPFTWKEVGADNYLISWQESDGSTVVHCDNFEKLISNAFYTTMDKEFYVMEGTIEESL